MHHCLLAFCWILYKFLSLSIVTQPGRSSSLSLFSKSLLGRYLLLIMPSVHAKPSHPAPAHSLPLSFIKKTEATSLNFFCPHQQLRNPYLISEHPSFFLSISGKKALLLLFKMFSYSTPPHLPSPSQLFIHYLLSPLQPGSIHNPLSSINLFSCFLLLHCP